MILFDIKLAMDVIVALVLICVVYGVLLFFDNFFKTCAHYPYIKFLEGTGIRIKFLFLKWTTKAINRSIIKLSSSRPRFFNLWLTCGLYSSLLLLPISILLLLFSIYQNISNKSSTNLVLEPLVPGVSLPVSELGYYSLTLIICSIIHELGHALGAVHFNVNVIDVGLNIFFILPVAFVNLSEEHFSVLNNRNKLKILCAGIWHNVVLSLFAYLLYLILPYIFLTFFHMNSGVIITEIAKKSPLIGEKGLNVGNIIININDCVVRDENSWYQCLLETEKYRPAFCVNSDLIDKYDESIPLKYLDNGNLDCCDSKKTGNICFDYLDTADGILEMPSHACLPGRIVIEESTNFCTKDPQSCPMGTYCFRPIVANYSNLFKIACNNKNVIYLGPPSDIYLTIEVSSYIPKHFFSSSTVPDVLSKFVRYISVISLGLAIVNVSPFLYMDGQHIIEVLLKLTCEKHMAKLITVLTTWCFTFLLIFHCIHSLWKLIL